MVIDHLNAAHSAIQMRALSSPLEVIIESRKVCIEVKMGLRSF